MSQVLVWKSDSDGKLFEDKTKYAKHLRKLAAARADERKVAKVEASREQFLIDMGNTVTSIEHLEQFIKDNWKWFAANGAASASWRKPANTEHKLVGIEITAQWRNSVSNSHRCPRGGVTNWSPSMNRGNGLNLPEGYPGWAGVIKFSVDAGSSDHKVPRKYCGFGSDYFDRTIVNTGSGGSGNGYTYSYSLELFAADFPAMMNARERTKVWNKISNQTLEFA
jgi:hypothetical protein